LAYIDSPDVGDFEDAVILKAFGDVQISIARIDDKPKG
jgi:hypothetical protein